MRTRSIVLSLAALAAAAATACIPPPEPPKQTTTTTSTTTTTTEAPFEVQCFVSPDAEEENLGLVAPLSTVANALFFDGSDSTCTGEPVAGPVTLAQADSFIEALDECSDVLGAPVTSVLPLSGIGFRDAPADVWLCIAPLG